MSLTFWGQLLRIALLSLLPLGGVAAQVSGTVLDPFQRPLENVIVVTWNGENEVWRVRTDSSGNFRFDSVGARGGEVLAFRHMGFRPLSLPIASVTGSLRVVLEPVVGSLPTVVASSVSGACPNREDTRARALWRATASKYRPAPPNASLRTLMNWQRAEARPQDVGDFDEAKIPPGEYFASYLVQNALKSSIQRDGYARRVSPAEAARSHGTFATWAYAPLHRDVVNHLIDAQFAESHSLSIAHQVDGSAIIIFCGRNRDRPFLEGALTVTSDTALVRAQWRFRTPKPEEDAAAEVSFVRLAAASTPWSLIPLRSVYWRRISGSKTLYFHEVSMYRSWRFDR